MCGLAHHDVAVARKIGASAMSSFDTSIADGARESDHHLLSLRFLRHGCQLRTDLEAFIAGSAMTPLLEFEVAKLAFVPLAERIGESLHAIVKQRAHDFGSQRPHC